MDNENSINKSREKEERGEFRKRMRIRGELARKDIIKATAKALIESKLDKASKHTSEEKELD